MRIATTPAVPRPTSAPMEGSDNSSKDVNSLYKKAIALKSELETQCEQLASQKGNASQGLSVAQQQRLGFQSSDFIKTVQDLRAEVDETKDKSKAMWARRASNLEDDLKSIQSSLDKHLGSFFKGKQEEESNRKALGLDRSIKKDDGDSTKAAFKERDSLRQSANMLDDILSSGQATLDNMLGQNKMLKGAKRKLLDAANVMGVSQSLVGVIDRRNKGDKWLVYGGMAFTLFILLSLWYLIRR